MENSKEKGKMHYCGNFVSTPIIFFLNLFLILVRLKI